MSELRVELKFEIFVPNMLYAIEIVDVPTNCVCLQIQEALQSEQQVKLQPPLFIISIVQIHTQKRFSFYLI